MMGQGVRTGKGDRRTASFPGWFTGCEKKIRHHQGSEKETPTEKTTDRRASGEGNTDRPGRPRVPLSRNPARPPPRRTDGGPRGCGRSGAPPRGGRPPGPGGKEQEQGQPCAGRRGRRPPREGAPPPRGTPAEKPGSARKAGVRTLPAQGGSSKGPRGVPRRERENRTRKKKWKPEDRKRGPPSERAWVTNPVGQTGRDQGER